LGREEDKRKAEEDGKVRYLLLAILIFAGGEAVGQEYQVLPEDVEACFPLEGIEWYNPEAVSITYLYGDLPALEHSPIVKREVQVWAAWLQKGKPWLGGVIMRIRVPQKTDWRMMAFRFWVRRGGQRRVSGIRVVVIRPEEV
jgi:hypothetical protein